MVFQINCFLADETRINIQEVLDGKATATTSRILDRREMDAVVATLFLTSLTQSNHIQIHKDSTPM